jgi:hypothetical protein
MLFTLVGSANGNQIVQFGPAERPMIPTQAN